MDGSRPQPAPISSRWCGRSRILRLRVCTILIVRRFFYAYHDISYLGVDRPKMNMALYDALKPGGELVVGDYPAKPGAGTSVIQTLHHSDDALIRSEIEAAGFKLIDHGDFLRVPGDTQHAHSHSSAQPVDIYMLTFRKPG